MKKMENKTLSMVTIVPIRTAIEKLSLSESNSIAIQNFCKEYKEICIINTTNKRAGSNVLENDKVLFLHLNFILSQNPFIVIFRV